MLQRLRQVLGGSQQVGSRLLQVGDFPLQLCTSAACTASIFLAALVTVRDDWMVLGAGDESWSIEREEDRGLAEGGVEAPPLLPPSLGRMPRRLMGDRFGVNSDVPVSAAIADVRGGMRKLVQTREKVEKLVGLTEFNSSRRRLEALTERCRRSTHGWVGAAS